MTYLSQGNMSQPQYWISDQISTYTWRENMARKYNIKSEIWTEILLIVPLKISKASYSTVDQDQLQTISFEIEIKFGNSSQCKNIRTVQLKREIAMHGEK